MTAKLPRLSVQLRILYPQGPGQVGDCGNARPRRWDTQICQYGPAKGREHDLVATKTTRDSGS
eukprot:2231268-Prymnesium_polylepis.2